MFDLKDFYTRLLELPSSWEVSEVVLKNGDNSVLVTLTVVGAARGVCPLCDRSSEALRRTTPRTWRHLDTCGRMTFLLGCLPILDCSEHGEQVVAPPWGEAESPVTAALEGWLIRVAGLVVDVRKASLLAGLDPTQVRRILARSRQRPAGSRSDSVAAEVERKPAESSPPARQLSLFDQEDMTLVNQGIQALRGLEPEVALDCFRKHQQRYPRGYNVALHLTVADRLRDGIREAPLDPLVRPGYFHRLWISMEEEAKSAGGQAGMILENIKTFFFKAVLGEVERAGITDECHSYRDIPLGLLFMQAGRLDEAIASLQSRIREMPHHAGLYGYLGDAYWLRGERRIARQCYREACLIEPSGVDWAHLMDGELKELREDLLSEYGHDVDLTTAWLPSHARIEGLFERKTVRVHDGLKELVQDYLEIEKRLKKQESRRLAAALFYRGLILCENPESLRFVKTIDLIQVRRRMKEANADLFEDLLELLGGSRA